MSPVQEKVMRILLKVVAVGQPAQRAQAVALIEKMKASAA